MRASLLCLAALCVATISTVTFAAEPLPPSEARKKVGEEIIVEMEVKAARNALAKRGLIFLDSEEDFRDPKNFAVVLTKNAAEKLAKDGVSDPVAHFKGKNIRATGKVALDQESKIPRITIDDPKHIEIVEKK